MASMSETGNEFAEATHSPKGRAYRRPHIRPPLGANEIVAIAITIAGLIFSVAPVAYWWPSIPSVIPSHFNIYGQPDAYGSKATLLIFPAVALGVTVLLQTLSRFPWVYNYPVRITPENAERNYRRGRALLRWVNAIIWLGGGIEWQALTVARGGATSLGPAFGAGLVIAIVILVPIGLMTLIVVWATRWS